MPFLVDSRRIDPADRLESLYEAFQPCWGARCNVSVTDLGGQGYASIEVAAFGPAEIVQIHGTGLTVRRTEHKVRRFEDMPYVAIAVPRSEAAFVQGGHSAVVRPGQAFVVDRSVPCELGWAGGGDSVAFQAPYQEFGLSLELIRAAAGRLASSPLSAVVADHVVRLGRDADLLSGDSSATEIGASTIRMIRALLISAVGDDGRARDAEGETLLLVILAYVRQHLTELDLTPLRIARAHNISLRQLYTLCRAADVRIAEWIFEQRLAGARLELQDPRLGSRTIELTARRWGFVDPTHFGRRFKAAYGVSPREFKHLSAA
jgi:AraC-like DNA-binding protein